MKSSPTWMHNLCTQTHTKSTPQKPQHCVHKKHALFTTYKEGLERERERRYVDLSGINVIEVHVRPTSSIMYIGHNISGARLLTPHGVGTIGTRVTIVDYGS